MNAALTFLIRYASYGLEAGLFLYYTAHAPKRSLPPWKERMAMALFVLLHAALRYFLQDALHLFTLVSVALCYGYCRRLCCMERYNSALTGLLFAISIDLGKILLFALLNLSFMVGTNSLSASAGGVLAIELGNTILRVLTILAMRHFTETIFTVRINRRIALSVLLPMLPFWYLRVFILRHFSWIKESGIDTDLFCTMLMVLALTMLGSIWAVAAYSAYTAKEDEMLRMERIMASRYQDLLERKATEEQIRRIYHDLHNQLSILSGLSEDQRVREHLCQIQAQIQPFVKQANTGNGVLDALLSEKTRLAASKGIGLETVMDFSRGNFIQSLDICAIFGNAIDNAIEACEKLPEPEQRLIRIRSACKDAFLVVNISNPFAAPLIRDKGGFSTTKPEPEKHGIGLSSIAHSLSKYGGQMTAHATDSSLFVLKILIPLPEGQPQDP